MILIVSRLLGLFLGSLIASLIGAVALRAGLAVFKIARTFGLGDAARTVFYPFLLSAGLNFGITWGATAWLGNQAWIPLVAWGVQVVVFPASLLASIRTDLNLMPVEAGKLTAMVVGVFAALAGGILLAAHLLAR